MSAEPASVPRRSSRHRWARWLAFGALAAVGAVLWFGRAPRLPEVRREALELIAGRLCLTGQTRPFTGWMLEYYPDGRLKSRSSVQAGLLHGVSAGYHTNGQIQVREHFRQGVSHGQRLKWYPSGQLLSEATIVNGRLHGLFRRWHENGQLAESIPMSHGVPDGWAEAFDPDGQLKRRSLLRAGQVVDPGGADSLAHQPAADLGTP